MSTVVIKKNKRNGEKREGDSKIFGVYMKSILDRKLSLSITEIGKNVKSNLEIKLDATMGGKCVSEGYIRPKSLRILNYSSGLVNNNVVEFHVVFEAMVCLPTENMLIECVCKTMTKAGIHAHVIDDEKNMPITMFIARDHHHLDDRFSQIKEGDKLKSKVIGIRYELDDEYISVLGKLM
jgi:DNA-directed RNA polymerase subunit E'/Rpb7